MKTRNSRWMKWVLEESARDTTPLPFARGQRRARTIARRVAAARVPSSRTTAPQPDHARG